MTTVMWSYVWAWLFVGNEDMQICISKRMLVIAVLYRF